MGHTRLLTIELRDFRNLAHVSLALPPEGVVVVGDNGQGKTNLLEGIAYLHLLRSVRRARDIDVVRFGSDGFSIRAQAAVPASDGSEGGASRPRSDARSFVLGFERATRRKRVTVDGLVPERLSDALGLVPSVTFSPTDVELVRGGPVERRAYLDVVLATTSRRYLAALQTYRAALLRRNAALRAVGDDADASQLEPWEPLLAQAGAVVWLERAVWVRTWGRELARVAAEIGERESIELRHVARLPGGRDALATGDLDGLRSAFAAALAAGRALDARHRATRIGPHRDDLLITVGERDLRTYASAGQHRTVAIALRIVEAATLRTHSGATPLLLLDDPFAELDERRARAILGVLGGDDMGQIVLAVPRSSDIPAGLTRLARITIAGGVISPPLQGAGHAAA